MERHQRRAFPEASKREAVDRVATSGMPAGAVARELGLHETVLRRWMAQFGTQATRTPRRPNTQAVAPSPSDLAAKNARLRRENERLRMERDVLKRAALMFGSAFAIVGPEGPYHEALARWCGGEPDHRTVALLSQTGETP